MQAEGYYYTSKGDYLVTLFKPTQGKNFCKLTAEERQPFLGHDAATHVLFSFGKAIRVSIQEFNNWDPSFEIMEFYILPDRVLMLVRFSKDVSVGLDVIINKFKTLVSGKVDNQTVFSTNYNSLIITERYDLNAISEMVRDAGRRYVLPSRFKDFFTRRYKIRIGDQFYQAVGDLRLLMNPFMEQVVIHSKDDDVKLQQLRNLWMYIAANGGVLVAPFVSRREKEIKRAADRMRAKIIHIKERPLLADETPGKREIQLIENGRLLLLAPVSDDFPYDSFRSQCLYMNSAAEKIAYYGRIGRAFIRWQDRNTDYVTNPIKYDR